MTAKLFSIGQKVWTIGTYRNASLLQGTVVKVGRKYVTTDRSTQYHLDTLVEKVDYGEEGRLYLTEQDYHDEIELRHNKSVIRSCLDRWSKQEITLDQSREILRILKP